jgi:hypothetical protein
LGSRRKGHDMLLDCPVSLSWGATCCMNASLIQDIAFLCKMPFGCTARSAQPLVPHQLTQDASDAGFVGARGFEGRVPSAYG